MSKSKPSEKLMKLASRYGALTARNAAKAGIHSQILCRLVAAGALERVARGQYRLPGADVSAQHSRVIASVAVPAGVLCLLSALSFHEIGTQLPAAVWMAIPRRARRPTLASPPLRIVRFSGKAYTAGIETHEFEGHTIKIYCPAKTVADCFKYRNKIGLDVAIEALREAWRDRRVTIDELDRYAEICRVKRVMRPYIEAMIS